MATVNADSDFTPTPARPPFAFFLRPPPPKGRPLGSHPVCTCLAILRAGFPANPRQQPPPTPAPHHFRTFSMAAITFLMSSLARLRVSARTERPDMAAAGSGWGPGHCSQDAGYHAPHASSSTRCHRSTSPRPSLAPPPVCARARGSARTLPPLGPLRPQRACAPARGRPYCAPPETLRHLTGRLNLVSPARGVCQARPQ